MAEIGISVAAKAAEYTVDPIKTQLDYMWNYKTNFKNLEKQLLKLVETRATVQHSVEEATRNAEEIELKVVNWLDSVNKINDEATKIIEDNNRANMRCFKSLCPDLKMRYQHSKKAADKANDVSVLLNEGNFGRISYRNLPEETWHPSSKPFEDFESRTSTLTRVINALSNPDVHMVGVHGMGGIGKTTLAREVGRKTEESKIFDVVVFVEVSDSPNIRTIQGVIADKLGLEFHQETEPGRANTLCERLKRETKILLILDNIWESLNLEKVGIPFNDDHRGCKLLLTARKANLLSDEMGCDCKNNFPIDILNEKEAWNLFKKIAGSCVEGHDLQSLACDVAKECGGLPIAIITVAKALKNKEKCEWKSALYELQHPTVESLEESVATKTYSCIKLSYDHLKSKELKSTFLLCSTMTFISYASIEGLLRYAMGLRLFSISNTMEAARDKVNTLIQKLKKSSLLLDTHDSEWFFIHDVVRDVGRAIAFKDHNKFTVTDDVIPRAWKDENTMKNCTSISLHDISKLPNMELNCPLLQFLYMKGKNEHSKIPDNFFIGMPNLRVLHLINMELSPHPSSLGCLVNLQTLCLNCSWLRDTGFIADIKDLEILVLTCKTIGQLPTEIGQLTQLRVLDLSKCYRLEIVPPSIISKLTQLEELYLDYGLVEQYLDDGIGYGFDNWHVEGLDNESGNASLDELKHLSQLTTLHIYIRDHKMVPKGLFSQQLQRYNICIGSIDRWDRRRRHGTSKTLKLKSDDSIVLEDGVVTQLKGIEELFIDGRQSVKNALYELDSDGFPQLKHFDIRNNPDLVYIVDSSKKLELPCDAFPLLETLSLTNLISLEKICHGQLTPNSFCRRLRTVNLDGCDNLKNVFSLSIAKHLSQLQDISVSNCKNMEDIFTVGRRNDINSNEEIDRIVLDQLHSLSLRRLPKLRSFCSEEATSNEIIPMPLFDGKVAKEDAEDAAATTFVFPQLTCLKLEDLQKLKCFYPGIHTIEWPVLKELNLIGCDKIGHSFVLELFAFQKNILEGQLDIPIQPLSLVKKVLSNLENLSLDGNSSRMIFQSQFQEILFPKLKHLKITNQVDQPADLPLGIFQGSHNLESLSFEGGSIKEIFWFEVVGKHTVTKKLSISGFENLEQIWKQDSKGDVILQNLEELDVSWCDSLVTLIPPSACFQNLTILSVVGCNGLLQLVSPSTAKGLVGLKEMAIKFCDTMTRVVADDEGAIKEDEIINFSKLKSLELIDLPRLTSLCSWNYTFNFPSLSLSGVVLTPMLREIRLDNKVYYCEGDVNTSLFFSHERLSLSLGDIKMILQKFPEYQFSKLKSLAVSDDESTIFPFEMLQQSHNLEQLKLADRSYKEILLCEEVEKQAETLAQLSLKELPTMSPCFQNLTDLSIRSCNNLKYLFSFSTLGSFVQIQDLTIRECKVLEAIIRIDEVGNNVEHPSLKKLRIEKCPEMKAFIFNDKEGTEDAAAITFVFPHLTCLELEDLQELRCFYPGIYTIEWPVLKELNLIGCDKIDQLFALELFAFPKNILEGQLDIPEQPLSLVKKVSSNLEELSLDGNSSRMIFQSQFSEFLFPKLKLLNIKNQVDQPADLPLGIFQRTHNLKSLSLEGGSNKEIFWFEEVGKHTVTKKLSISRFENLEQIWKQDSKVDVILQNLEELDVSRCDSLVTLMPPSACFQNLTILRVDGCRGLLQLVSSSTAKGLVGLKEMTIQFCDTMTRVVADDEGAIKEDEIINFSKLKSLELFYLSRLTSFCSWNYAFNFPSLERLSVVDCPKMKTFASGVVLTPMLRQIQLDFKDYYCEGDVNTSVQQIHEELLFSRKRLSLSLGDIKMILQKSPEHQFSKLKSLVVSDDESMVFPFEMLQQSHNLEQLTLADRSYKEILLCEEIEKQAETLAHLSLKELPTMSPCFQNLTDLSVQSCNNLKYLFSFSTLGSFVQLQDLTIRECKVLEAIIRIDELGNNVEYPSLKKLKIARCPELKAFIFNDKVSFPNLEEIQISNMKNLEMIWHNQLTEDSMNAQHCQKLSKVDINSCISLKKLFPPSIARNLFQLKDLYVIQCGIEEIIAKEGAEDAAAMTFVFPQLTCLKLQDVQELKCFYPGIHTIKWPVLKELNLIGCDKIDQLFAFQKNILDDQLDIPVLSNLENLSLDGNSNRMIFENQFPEILFPKLKLLKIKNLDDQSADLRLGIFQISHNLESLSLEGGSNKEIFWFEAVGKHTVTKKLSISDFENLEQIWKQDSKVEVILQNLEELDVSRCDSLVTLIPPSACFQNLTILRVSSCRGLLQLVSSSTAKGLVGLKEMTIRSCNAMTRVVADDEGAITKDEIINFSKLKSLELFYLSRLTSFCSWNYTFNFPSLERLCVYKCPKMKTFASGVVLTPMLREIELDYEDYYCEGDVNTSMQQIHEKMVFSGERLSLNPRDIKMILQKFPRHQISKLKSLDVFDDDSTVFPFEMIKRFYNLKELKLIDCSYQEMFFCEEVEKQAKTLAQLKSLILYKLDHLEHVWKQDSKQDLILHTLETLLVLECNSLITLMPVSASFQNLRSLQVWKCNGLTSLLSSSTAKSLVRLEHMDIGYCNTMTEIVATEDVEEDKIIIFSKLWSLELDDLSSLASFCSGNHTTLNFPSLESLDVRKCRKMKFFSSGVSSTPLLQRIEYDFNRSIWEGDLNTTIQQIHEELNLESSTKGCVSHIE